jgi:hypothetical protein
MTRQDGLNEVLQRKVNDFVNRSRVDGEALVERLKSREIDDAVIPTSQVRFEPHNYGGLAAIVHEVSKKNNTDRYHNWQLTRHSTYQLADRIGIPQKWAADVALSNQHYKQDAVAYALNQYIANYTGKDDRFLFRNVDGVTRGILSTGYKRLNTREIFLMFTLTAQLMDLPIVGAFEGTSRDYIECLCPTLVYLDTPNNGVVAYARGMQLKNSDFGDGYLELRSWGLYGACLNGNTGKSFLKEVHLGSRIDKEFVYSIQTINAETEARALMVRDRMEYVFSEKNMAFEEAQIMEASDAEVDLEDEIQFLPKLGVTKDEAQAIQSILMKRDPDDGITGKPSKLMVAQAVSAYGRTADNITTGVSRKRELQQIAGNMIFTKEPEYAEVSNTAI